MYYSSTTALYLAHAIEAERRAVADRARLLRRARRAEIDDAVVVAPLVGVGRYRALPAARGR